MSRILIASLLGWLVVFSAAADTPHNEIVYRTNLGRADDVKLLLKQGVSPDEKNDDGVPLLALAVTRNDKEGANVMKALLEAGAHVDARDSQGQTALFYAVKQGNKKAVDYLLSKGADYYAVDNSGNTARNLAYTSGHQDIGVAIDDFVKALGAERAEQYRKFNEAIAERLTPPETTPMPVKTDAPPQSDQPALTPEEQAAQEAAQKKRQDEIKQLASDLAFNNCAFQYWSYVNDAGQSTELSPEALDDAVDSYKNKVEAIQDQFIKDYQMDFRFINKVSNSAKQRIFDELNTMPSKAYRHEQGVGKQDDVKSRCQTIARHWDKEPPPPSPPKKGIMNPGMMAPH